MKCPSCIQELKPVFAGNLTVHTCHAGCGGLWFGHYELLKLEGSFFGEGERLLEVPRAEGVRFFRDVEAICPQCKTCLLFRHFFSKERGVEVCQCSKCGGFWLDPGELAGIPSRANTEEPRKQLTTSFFQSIFRDRIAKMDLHIEDVLQAARSMVRIFYFICPKKYPPRDHNLQKEYFGDLMVLKETDKGR